jgi:septum formation protein
VAKLYIEKMADAEIEMYLDTGSPYDKAGAYGVQDKDLIYSKILQGDMYTIMGLPKYELEDDLVDLGIIE